MSRSSTAPTLSIVVSAPADAGALEATLVSVLENRPAGAEIVVAHGFSYEDPWRIADEVRLVPAPPGSGLAACANVGIATSAAEVIHVLAAGWLATPGWTDVPSALLAAGGVKAVVPLGVSAAVPDAVVSAGIRLGRGGRRSEIVRTHRPRRVDGLDASRLRPDAPVLEAGFWRADVLAAAGPGFATCCGDWLADADMAAALECLPGRVVVAPESRVICGPRRTRPRAFTAGLQAERLFMRSLARGSAVAAVVGHVVEVVRDAVAVAPLGTLPALAGRLAALMQFADFLPRLVHLRALRATAGAATGPILRIDGAHSDLARPHHGSADVQPLRRSA